MLQRELETYENPLPSREYILQIVTEQGVPLTFERLVKLLDIRTEEEEFFIRRLGAMARDGQLMQNRGGNWLLPDKANLVTGRVQGHMDGFGFLVPDDGSPDLFLSAREMEKVLHGDRAMARVAGTDQRGRPEGKIVEVLERANSKLVGRVYNEHGVWFVEPENKRISQRILLAPPEAPKKGLMGRLSRAPKPIVPVAGQVVMVDIIEQPSRNAQAIGRVTEIVGNYADPGMEIEIALRKHELPYEFSKEGLAEAKKLPDVVRPADKKGREDITHLPLVTIDGETARDFDDAVYCERQGKGYRLIVAIADVSHYVKERGDLDLDAYERGNSVYFPRRVIPMLPEKISNGLCSLNPQVERLCMVCDMDIGPTGEVKRYRFYPAVMFSHARLTYNEVAAAIHEKEIPARRKIGKLLPQLEMLDELYRLLAAERKKRGAIDFESTETRMIFNDNGKIDRIVPDERNEAHKIIEECMLAANVCASAYLAENEQPCLYRIHQGPSPERLTRVRDFLGTFGLQLGGGEEPHAKDYAALIDKIKGRPDATLLQTVMLRSLRQAIYSPDNVGHFGLAYDHYTHFTSPIRRYPDLLVHRAIKAVLQRKKYEPDHEAGDWENVGLHCSMTERRADEATRDVEDWLKCFYMQDKIGEIFSGSIASVVPFGIFVALDDVFIEGLVHVSELGTDYFHFDDAAHAMVGERTGKRYRLSDRVKVQLVRVDLATNKIDFKLAVNPVDKIIGTSQPSPETDRGRSGKRPAPAKKAQPRARRGRDEVSAMPGGVAPVKQDAGKRGGGKQGGRAATPKKPATGARGAAGPQTGRKKKR
ncbi:MAG: ribonuclease R [Rhodocyclaceae bacterium]|nr:ribonuclease R [Rhodocyclaceae bacterium]